MVFLYLGVSEIFLKYKGCVNFMKCLDYEVCDRLKVD